MQSDMGYTTWEAPQREGYSMAMNRIQFQLSLVMTEFFEDYSTGAQLLCGTMGCSLIEGVLYGACWHWTSLMAGILMQAMSEREDRNTLITVYKLYLPIRSPDGEFLSYSRAPW